MRWIRFVGCLWLAMASLAGAALKPESVVILYNENVPESAALARYYASARGIPSDHLIGLDTPAKQVIDRETYEKTIAVPLRQEFTGREWWHRRTDANGILQPVHNEIRVLVTMRGVPYKIHRKPVAKPAVVENTPDGKPAKPKRPPIGEHDEASVDSELAMLGVEVLPAGGPLPNAYHKSDKRIMDAGLPFLMLTARIDAPTIETCRRMINDALDVESTGLWGMAYVDIANKIKQGDDWLNGVVERNAGLGIPTVVDRFNPTLPSHYPARDMALYYGWYDSHVSGPFLNPGFRLRKGAVAMHLHSFSAGQLENPERNWSGALLERGAAVTIGNVYEPYLGMTHHFDIVHQRLTEGFTWVEACWSAMPVTSWQGVVLGDPLYRPFLHLDGSGQVAAEDREYRAIRAAMLEWRYQPTERRQNLTQAAGRMNSGVLAEAVGLEWLAEGKPDKAHELFMQAKQWYADDADRLRQDLHNVAIERVAKRKPYAILGLRVAEQKYAKIPEVLAVKGWLDILDPPPPPPATPPAAGSKPGAASK